MRLRTATLALVLWLLAAAPAFAGDNGQGVVGETDDKLITFFSFGVMGFFTLLVIVLTLLQSSRDKRKEQRKATELRRRVGW
jgi:preprotein translocase subunit SecG